MKQGVAAFGRALEPGKRAASSSLCWCSSVSGLLPGRLARGLVVVVYGAFLLVERLPIRSSVDHWLRWSRSKSDGAGANLENTPLRRCRAARYRRSSAHTLPASSPHPRTHPPHALPILSSSPPFLSRSRSRSRPLSPPPSFCTSLPPTAATGVGNSDHLTQRAATRTRHGGRTQEQSACLRQGAGGGALGERARERYRRARGAGAHRLPARRQPGNVCRFDELMIILQCRPKSGRCYRWRTALGLFKPQHAAPLQLTLIALAGMLAAACDGLVGASCPFAGVAGTCLEEPPSCCCLCAPASTLVTAPSGPWILILYLLPQSPRCLSSLSWKPITTPRHDRATRSHIKSRQSRASV